MERNWLIRTKQNQILGPVAKAKVIEFYQKGALGLDDEICSGNGYWFSFKEKDLIEKYLLGDVPQGYNPISESRSHLSKNENPDRTTSLNAAPINAKVDTLAKENGPIVLPDESELDYPDITLVNKVIEYSSSPIPSEEVKLPTQDDLEFPNIESISKRVEQAAKIPSLAAAQEEEIVLAKKSRPLEKKEDVPSLANEAVIVYPEDDDLAYPDLSAMAPVKSSLELREKSKEIKVNKDDLVSQTLKKEKSKDSSHSLSTPVTEEKKILHERKTKSSPRPIQREEATLPLKTGSERKVPEEFKKRNDNYLMYILVMIVFIMIALFFYYYRTILNKPLPV
ncbi:MAG: hypothetical protein KBD76_01000 [Bacteriovorax sp.]|nr:hypothetical protein [Bacteriovorax sp.]